MSIVYIEGSEEKPNVGDKFQEKLEAYISTRQPKILLREIFVTQRLRFGRTLRGLNVLVDLAEGEDESENDLFRTINTPGFRINRLLSGIKIAVYCSDVMGRGTFGMKAFQKSWTDLMESLKGVSGGINSSVTRMCSCPTDEHEDLGCCEPVGQNLSVRIHGDVRTVVGIYCAMQLVIEGLSRDPDAISAVHGMDFIAGNRNNTGSVVQLVPK